MAHVKEKRLPSRNFAERLGSMLRVDARRMFGTPLFWICLGIAFVIPVLVLVMTSAFGGEGNAMFTNTWQIIGSESADLGAMMNINLMYFMMAVFVCLFTAEDFRSGYAKNLFTVRARKTDYVASKTIIGFIAGALFLIAFFIGGVVGGSVAGLSFELGAAGVSGLVMCMLAKIFLTAVFVAIFLLMSVIAKSRSWMSICLSLFGGMLLFMMIPMMTPLDSGIMNVGLCLAGGAIFAAAIGAVSNVVLKKSSLVG
ncbi:MAG: ABC transporter permease [Blautia sp.]|nr:ABC transporter permease [Blautia sp.]